MTEEQIRDYKIAAKNKNCSLKQTLYSYGKFRKRWYIYF